MNTIFAVGAQLSVLADNTFVLQHLPKMPEILRQNIHSIPNVETGQFDAIFHHGTHAELTQLQDQIAKREGAIIAISHFNNDQTQLCIEPLIIERALSINTAAAGGNASLMTLES